MINKMPLLSYEIDHKNNTILLEKSSLFKPLHKKVYKFRTFNIIAKGKENFVFLIFL